MRYLLFLIPFFASAQITVNFPDFVTAQEVDSIVKKAVGESVISKTEFKALIKEAVSEAVGQPAPQPTPEPIERIKIVGIENGSVYQSDQVISVDIITEGTVAKYEVFLNGVKVDTDLTTYTPYKITGLSAGVHRVSVKITDVFGDEYTDEKILTIQ